MKSFASPICRFTQRALIVLSFFGMAEMGWGQTAQILPYSFNSGSSSMTSANGWTNVNVGSDYSDTGSRIKFDATAKTATLYIASAPLSLTYNLKGNGFSGGTFTISESENGTTFTTLRTVTALTTSNVLYTDVPSLATRYIKWTYTTKATGNVGMGTISISSATPNAPTGISITPGNQQLSVAYTTPSSNGGSAISNYKYSTDGGTNFTAVSPPSTSSPIVIAGLTNGTSYNVQIRAINANGDGAATASASATPRTVPGAPTIETITPGNQQLSVAFTAGSDGGSAITTYKYSTNGGANWQTRSIGTTASPLVISTLSTDGTTALTNGVSYDIQIRAVNAAGDGTATASATATPRTTPSAPTITSIIPGNGQLSVAFTAGSDGGSSITDYKWSVDGTNYTTRAGTASPIVITGLTNGTAYTVRIRAVNVAGDGTVATASAAATPATTPSAPTITSITPGNQELSVAFTSGATGGSAITNYMYSTDGGSSFTAVSPAVTASPITITGLTNGTTYNVQIKAVNAQGEGIATASTTGTPSAAAVAPGAPTITSITPGNGQLSVAFTAGATGGSAITNYKYSTDGGATFTALTPSATTSPITIAGLINGTSYDVQIRAVNAIGDGTPTVSTTATPATTPSAPIINGIIAGNAQLSVVFTAGPSGGSAITNYKYSTDGGSTFTTLSPATTTSPITITGLSNGTSYNVQIKAVNAIGDGIATASSLGTPATTPGAPTIGIATAGNGQATVTFTAPVSNGGSAITSYTATSTPGSIIGTLNQAGSGTITVTGLTNGTAYTFTVKANNAAGASTASAASNSVTPVLTSPVANTASSILENGFTANWDAVTNATGYKLDVSTSSNFSTTTSTPNTQIVNNTGSIGASGWTETNVAQGSVSINNYLQLLTSTSIVITPSMNFTSFTSCSLNFSARTFGGPSPAQSTITVSISVNGGSFISLGSTIPTSSTISAMTAYNLGAYSGSSTIQIKLETLGAGSNKGVGIDDITVAGTQAVVIPSFVAGYEDLTISGTSKAVTGLSENTTYYYRMRATDGSASANSNVITVTTKKTPNVTPIIGSYTYNGSVQGPNSITALTPTPTSVTYSYEGAAPTSYGPSSTRPTNAGSYTVTATVEEDANYISGSSTESFTIAQKPLTITANSVSKCFGTTYTLGTTAFSTSGLISGDAVSSVTLTSAGAASNASAGNASIVPSAAQGSGLSNYSITYNNGTLTVNATGTWIGTSTGNWNDGANWCGGIPTSSTNVIIPANTTVTISAAAAANTINSSGTLSLTSTGKLSVEGTITNNGTISIADGGSLVQTGSGSDSNVNTGGIYKVYKTLDATTSDALAGNPSRYWYIGSPVSGETAASDVFGNSGTPKLWLHNSSASTQWQQIFGDGYSGGAVTMTSGRGYLFRSTSAANVIFDQQHINNGTITLSGIANTTPGSAGYNLISNPYPSTLNWTQFRDANPNLASTYWVRTFDPQLNAGNGMKYSAYNANGGQSVNGSTTNEYIAPMQAFWVYAPTGTISVTFNNGMRSHGTSTLHTLENTARVRFHLTNGTYTDEALVYVNEDAQNTNDTYDSDKIIVASTAYQIYCLEGTKRLSIDGIQNALVKDTVQVGVQIPLAATYTINATEIGIDEDVFLEDKITGAYQNLKTTPNYSFTSVAGTFNNRFVLHFAPFVPALPGQTAATAIAMPTSNWPQCNNVSTEDQWHAFTATSEGVSIEVNTASTDIVIELQDGTGNVVAQENVVNGIGNETLNFFGLTAGQTYKVGVRNNISNQPTGTYGICVKSLKRGGCDYGAGPYSLCQYYKATWAGSTGVSYTFTFTGTSGPAAGQTFTRTQNSDICVLSTVTPVLPYGSTYDVTISNTYTLTDGAGNTEQVTVPSNSGCQVVTIAQPQTTLSASSSCNNGPRFRGAVVSSMPWVCGANNWRWRFTEVNPLTLQAVGLPIELNRGAASNYLNLGTVNQLQSGKTYAVQTAPLFTYTASNYNWGPVQYMCIVGVAQGALQDAEQGVAQGSTKDAVQGPSEGASQENDVLVYTTTGHQIKVWTNIDNAELTNATVRVYNSTGSLVYTQRMSSNEMIIDLNTAAGLYIVEVGEVKRKVVISPLAP